jgi:predicted metal-dependent peptidase
VGILRRDEMKLTTEQKVQRAHVALMGNPDYCLYSGIFMLGETKVVDDVPTACTNGRDVSYGRKFIDGLKEEEIRGTVLHENLHKAFRHLTTWKALWKEDAELANMACDYVINLMIYDSDVEGKFVKIPDGGCLDTKYRGMDAGTVYRLLK